VGRSRQISNIYALEATTSPLVVSEFRKFDSTHHVYINAVKFGWFHYNNNGPKFVSI
jgi:hypothetical protein